MACVTYTAGTGTTTVQPSSDTGLILAVLVAAAVAMVLMGGKK